MSGRVFATVGVQAALVAVAMVWRHLQGASAWHDGAPLGTTHAIAVPAALSLGALTGVAAVAATRALVRSTAWGRAMHTTLRDAVLDLEGPAAPIAAIAIATAVGEELLFRGAMLPSIAAYTGLPLAWLLSSLAFGLVHVPSSRALVPWTLTACVMGLVFGLLYVVTGEVLAPIAAHAMINHENMHFLLANDLGGPSGRRDDRTVAAG
jgi:membrane protease YdiL (CAAX protease family)